MAGSRRRRPGRPSSRPSTSCCWSCQVMPSAVSAGIGAGRRRCVGGEGRSDAGGRQDQGSEQGEGGTGPRHRCELLLNVAASPRGRRREMWSLRSLDAVYDASVPSARSGAATVRGSVRLTGPSRQPLGMKGDDRRGSSSMCPAVRAAGASHDLPPCAAQWHARRVRSPSCMRFHWLDHPVHVVVDRVRGSSTGCLSRLTRASSCH